MNIDAESFEEIVLKSDIPVLVDFWASWCLPCKLSETLINKIEKEYETKAKICKVNVDQNPGLQREYDIKGLPTYMTFNNGQVVEKKVGALTENQLKSLIDSALNAHNHTQ